MYVHTSKLLHDCGAGVKKMPDNENQTVDGFSDNTTEQRTPTHGEQAGVPGSPDPGQAQGGPQPMSAEEFARMKKEAQEDDNANRGDR